MKALLCLCLAVGLAPSLASCSPSRPLPHPLTPTVNVQLPKEAHTPVIDLATFDTRSHHLYLAHVSNGSVDIIDTASERYIGSIDGTTDVKAIALSADPNIIYTSDGATQKVGKADVAQRKLIKEIAVGGSPDGIAYDPVRNLVLASLANTTSLAVIDAKTDTLKATIPLDGTPELSVPDPKTGNLFQVINTQNSVVEIDTSSNQILTTYKGCDLNAPKGIVYDADQGRLFVANKGTLSIIDLLIDKCMGSVDVGSGADQVAFDPTRHHVYVANSGSRTLSVIDSNTFKPLGEVGTGPGAGNVAVDPATGKVYVTIGRAGIVAVYHDP